MFSVRKSTKPLLVLVILLIVDRSQVPIALDQPHGHGLDPLVLAPVNGRFLALLTLHSLLLVLMRNALHRPSGNLEIQLFVELIPQPNPSVYETPKVSVKT
jgi:hypothetical protein